MDTENKIELMLQHARNGDVTELGVLEESMEEYNRVIKEAIKYGQLIVIQKCISVGDLEYNENVVKCICRYATKYDQLAILQFVVQELGLGVIGDMCDATIVNTAIEHSSISVLEWWEQMRESDPGEYTPMEYGSDMLNHAVRSGQSEVLLWLLEHGYRTQISCRFKDTVTKEKQMEVIKVLHLDDEYDDDVGYTMGGWFRDDCKNGKCAVCTAEKMWEIWILESQEFTDNVQWLPKEIMEDTLALL